MRYQSDGRDDETNDRGLPDGTEHVVAIRDVTDANGTGLDVTPDPSDSIRYEPGDELPRDLAAKVWDAFGPSHLLPLDADGQRLRDRSVGASPNDRQRHDELVEDARQRWERGDGWRPGDDVASPPTFGEDTYGPDPDADPDARATEGEDATSGHRTAETSTYTCAACGASFDTQNALNAHQGRHRAEDASTDADAGAGGEQA